MKKLITITIFLALLLMQATAQTGTITNISVQQRTDGSGLLDVLFSINGEENSYRIYLEASLDDGQTYTAIDPAFLTGAQGLFLPDSLYHIVWDGYGSFPDTYSEESILKIMAIYVIGRGVPCPGMPSFTDERDNKTYNTVLIGEQCWMKENLNYISDTSWCFEENEVLCDKYGSLYSWEWAMAGDESSNSVPSGVQGVCPAGWHLPSDAEWQIMLDYLMAEYEITNEWCDPNGVGKILKSCRQVNSPLGAPCATEDHPRWDDFFNEECQTTFYGTDDVGFSGLPAGKSWSGDGFFDMGTHAMWWSSTETDQGRAFGRELEHDSGGFYKVQHYTNLSVSIRCIRD